MARKAVSRCHCRIGRHSKLPARTCRVQGHEGAAGPRPMAHALDCPESQGMQSCLDPPPLRGWRRELSLFGRFGMVQPVVRSCPTCLAVGGSYVALMMVFASPTAPVVVPLLADPFAPLHHTDCLNLVSFYLAWALESVAYTSEIKFSV